MEPMRATIRDAGGAGTAAGWAAAWKAGQTIWVRWNGSDVVRAALTRCIAAQDLGGPTRVLLDEVVLRVADGSLVPKGASALVPGCGAAYDVKALADLGFARVVGADIAEEAVARARDVVSGSANAEVLCADFFKSAELVKGDFTFLFDYTFFCAIPPSLRAAWGERTAALLQPGGSLLTLVFPLASDEVAADLSAHGPPFPVSVAEYRKALEPHGMVMDGEPRESASSVRPELVVWWRKNASAL